MTGWRACLRVARRSVRRSPARSLLVVTLVALPVLAGGYAAVLVRTAQLSPAEQASRLMGRADAVVLVTTHPQLDADSVLLPDGAGIQASPSEAPTSQRDATAVDLRPLLPAGSSAVPVNWTVSDRYAAGHRLAQGDDVRADLASPITAGTVLRTSGRWPRSAGEVALSSPLAHALRVGVGDRITSDQRGTLTVVGIARDPVRWSRFAAWGPGALRDGAQVQSQWENGATWLVRFPAGHRLDTADKAHLAAAGALALTRSTVLHPPAGNGHTTTNPQTLAVLTALAVFGLGEVVLLAGAAFAVGARRQAHELGLVGAVGGDQRAVRGMVVAQGAVLGVVGAVVGAALAVLAVEVTRNPVSALVDRSLGHLDVRPLELGAVALVGVAAGVAAAWLPASAIAKLPVLAALQGRFRTTATDARAPRWAVAAVVVGLAAAVADVALWRRALLAAEHAGPSGAAYYGQQPADLHYTVALVACGAVVLAGAVRCTAALITWASRHCGRLPLTARLAVRDAGRHRSRTVPAVAAVMAATAGAVALLFVVASTDVKDRRTYLPELPTGDAAIYPSYGPTGAPAPAANLEAAARRVAADLPVAATYVVRAVVDPSVHATADQPPATLYASPADPNDCAAGCPSGEVDVGDATLVDFAAGRHVPEAAAALAAGKVVVLDRRLASHGRISIDLQPVDGSDQAASVALPAVVITSSSTSYRLPRVVVPAVTAAAHHWTTVTTAVLLATSRAPTKAEATRAVDPVRDVVQLDVERGYQSRYGIGIIALLAGGGLVTLVGTSIAVALALAESRADLATLAAVGAPPAQRRRLAALQALTVGGTGTVLGLALGCVLGVGLLAGSTSYPMTVPVRWLALLVVAVPGLVTLASGAVTRSRLPMTRRAA